jgi:hypothetical protein
MQYFIAMKTPDVYVIQWNLYSFFLSGSEKETMDPGKQ